MKQGDEERRGGSSLIPRPCSELFRTASDERAKAWGMRVGGKA